MLWKVPDAEKVWPAYWQFEYFLNGVNGWKTSLQCTADHFCRRVEFYIWFSLSLSLAADASLRRRPSLSLSFNQPKSPFPVFLKSFPWPLPHSLASGCKVSGAQRNVLNALLKNVVTFPILWYLFGNLGFTLNITILIRSDCQWALHLWFIVPPSWLV